jgi:hypothetical protein
MELLNAPSIFINDLKAKNKKSGETHAQTHARIFQINFILTDGVGLAADLSLRLRFDFLFEYI